MIRSGNVHDFDHVLRMFDDAVVWLTERGSAGQWGTVPWSTDERRRARVRGLVDGDGLHIAEVDGRPAGALVIREEPDPHIPPVDERELYVRLLITAREFAGRSVGSRLLDFAKQSARDRGISLVRVDCWAGGDGKLVAYYESQGFTRTQTFAVGDWAGQVLAQRVL